VILPFWSSPEIHLERNAIGSLACHILRNTVEAEVAVGHDERWYVFTPDISDTGHRSNDTSLKSSVL